MTHPQPGIPTSEHPPWDVKVLYDHACPMCRREVTWLNRRDKDGRIFFEDISAASFDAGRYGLEQSAVEGAIHGVMPDGTIIHGVEVFRRMYSAVGLGWLLAPTRWPLLRQLADRAYIAFARRRIRIGAAMGRDCTDGRCTTQQSAQTTAAAKADMATKNERP